MPVHNGGLTSSGRFVNAAWTDWIEDTHARLSLDSLVHSAQMYAGASAARLPTRNRLLQTPHRQPLPSGSIHTQPEIREKP